MGLLVLVEEYGPPAWASFVCAHLVTDDPNPRRGEANRGWIQSPAAANTEPMISKVRPMLSAEMNRPPLSPPCANMVPMPGAVPFSNTKYKTPYHPVNNVLRFKGPKEVRMAKQVLKVASEAANTPKKAAPRRRRIGITMEPDEVKRIDALIETVSASEAAREFGVEVDRSLVLRIAVIRGLAVMEAGAASPRSVTLDGAVAKSGADKAVKGAKEAKKPDESVKRAKNGHILPPDGWNQWKPGERIPEAHAAAHEYYTTKGWKRWWGKAGDENIVFYWIGDERLHGVELFDGKGPDGTLPLVQKTPYGVGHLIPHSWTAA